MSGHNSFDPTSQSEISYILSKVGCRLFLGLVLCGFLVERTISAESNSAQPATSSEQSSTEEVASRIYELGNFEIHQLWPTRNVTINLKFELHLLMPKGWQEQELEKRLNRWTQRLRDQVITAVRNAESKDFTESDLVRLQRMIRLRINRLLKFTRIEEVYITRFEFVQL